MQLASTINKNFFISEPRCGEPFRLILQLDHSTKLKTLVPWCASSAR
jgi:hypothetical protein